MELIFWQNILSPHQSALTRALGEAGHEVVVVATEGMTTDRQQMGWKVPDFGKARIIIGPDEKEIENIVSQGTPETIHILGGARWTPLGHRAIKQCIRQRKRFGIMSEPADDRSWRGCVRWVIYTTERITNGRYFDFILAMGETGVRWFQSCGYADRQIFPFAYFTESPSEGTALPAGTYDASSVKILFLGQCILRKAVDVLWHAFVLCADMDCNLTILGDGVFKPKLQAIVSSAAYRDRVRFLPAMDNESAMLELQKADLLVLPSRFDGWGAVVNEALMRGVPVICSDHCGAADLVRDPWRGAVFRSGSAPALAQELRDWIARGKRSQETSERIKTWSRCIGGREAARYMVEILDHIYHEDARPEAPWTKKSPIHYA